MLHFLIIRSFFCVVFLLNPPWDKKKTAVTPGILPQCLANLTEPQRMSYFGNICSCTDGIVHAIDLKFSVLFFRVVSIKCRKSKTKVITLVHHKVLLFPVDRDTHKCFCHLHSNVFDAARCLYVTREDIFLCLAS